MTKISIIVPTFNSEKYIKNCLKSIFNQSFSNYEIIICDNLSEDNTINLIKKFSYKFKKKIKIYSRRDKGVADALNFGFRKANGDILCWLNSDDFYNHKFVLNNVIDSFINNKKKSYLVGNFINIDSKNNILKYFHAFIPVKKLSKIFFYNQILTGAFFFKKEVFRSFKKFNTKYKYAFEYEIIIHTFKKYEGIYLNDFLCRFRILPNALSSNKIELRKEFDEILKKNKLKYSNSIFLKTYIYILQNVVFEVVKNKIKFYLK
jgi:glycosyltransferase involved in cell wall biosynthesis